MSSLSQTAITRFPRRLMQVQCGPDCSPNERENHLALLDGFSGLWPLLPKLVFQVSLPAT